MFLVSENGARPRLDSRAEEAESERQKESGGLIHGHSVSVVCATQEGVKPDVRLKLDKAESQDLGQLHLEF